VDEFSGIVKCSQTFVYQTLAFFVNNNAVELRNKQFNRRVEEKRERTSPSGSCTANRWTNHDPSSNSMYCIQGCPKGESKDFPIR